MATTYTELLDLPKHDVNDPFDITLINEMADKVDTGMAKAYRGQAAHNLLDNSYFLDIVNQRGAASYTGNKFGFDRWKGGTSNSIAEITDNGLTLTHGGTSSIAALAQTLPEHLYNRLKDETLTVAVCMADGTIACRSGVASSAAFNANVTGGYAQLYIPSGTETLVVRLINNVAGSSMTFRWVALYEGAYTADNLPTYQPKGYGTELMECMRYFRVYATQTARPANSLDASPPMRPATLTKGTVTIDGATCYYNSAEL